MVFILLCFVFFFFKQKTAYEWRISAWSSDVCSSDLGGGSRAGAMTQSIAHAARAVLLTADPAAKVRIARAMARAWRRGLVRHDFDAPMPDMPARPAEPELLPPNQMPKRGRGGSERGRIA